MCYHISLAAGSAELAARYGRKTDLIEQFGYLYRVQVFGCPDNPTILRPRTESTQT